MIEYQRDQQQTIPDSQVKIVGVGGAGLNMMDRVALDGMQGVELLALASDARTLSSSIAQEKVQLGSKLTMGLGCGGDPDLGLRAAQEQETEIRDALRDRSMVFICAGLGGGTGSGAAPLVARIAREMGAFVVVFATMPFEFEGKRRRDQAQAALDELSVIANALVTFENSRMGELVLAAQGIHEAFAAGDRMISQSIQAVTRLVVRPGLINIGLDELVSSLRATRSRCLFGSGMASGENRSQAALQNALTSPLLDKGRLLKDSKSVLVHICGGENITLYEVELLMRELSKQVPEDAHLLFGAAVDPNMGDSLSVTLISSLPESDFVESLPGKVIEKKPVAVVVEPVLELDEPVEVQSPVVEEPEVAKNIEPVVDLFESTAEAEVESEGAQEDGEILLVAESSLEKEVAELEEEVALLDEKEVEEPVKETPEEEVSQYDFKGEEEEVPASDLSKDAADADVKDDVFESEAATEKAEDSKVFDEERSMFEAMEQDLVEDVIEETMKKNALTKGSQAELELDGGPRGKFEGEAPNLVDGEDLDIPPYLRNKK